MEPIGAIAEGEWSSLSGMYTTEEADFMAQLLGNCPVTNELHGSASLGNSSAFWGSHESTMNTAGFSYSLDVDNSNSYCFSRGTSTYTGGSSILFPNSSSQESLYLSDSHPILGTNNNSSSISLDFCMGDANNTSSYLIDQGDVQGLNNPGMSERNVENLQSGRKQQMQPELGFPVKTTLQPKRESGMNAAPEPATEDKLNNPSENSKKRSRNVNTADAQKNKKNVKAKKNPKAAVSATNNEEENENNNNDAGLSRQQASSSCCSEDESNASQDQNGGETSSMSSKGKAAVNLNGKTRASRGSATDPQSLYARKRRERINERLRILQNLVPNGTKVDISTMLEEAVQYVKFLQLQIKLLSSDELWMYAPIAYNGMNIGLDHLKITASRLS